VNIPIFDAPWLEGGKCVSGEGQNSEVIQHAKIHSLIDHNLRCWNQDVIYCYFDDGTAQQILKTPLFELFRQVEEDQIIGKAGKNRHYSVRSAYRICMEEIGDNSYLHRPGFWNEIWKLKAPPKVKNLIWRICRGCLPTRAKLLDKRVNCTSMCSMCDGNYEDDLHVMFDCQRARSVWRDSHLSNDIYAAMQTNNTAADIVFALLQNLPHTKIQLFVTVVWSLWKSRNIQVWQNMPESSQSIVERAQQQTVAGTGFTGL
jgi:hypothetical protein